MKRKILNYFICGFSGAGKSTLLNKLKSDPNYEDYHFIDLDEYILSKYPEFQELGPLIEKLGFGKFRSEEERSLEEIVLRKDELPCILALGGGTLNNSTVRILKSWCGIWLNTDFETCYDRISQNKNLPLVSQNTKEELYVIYKRRVEFYSLFADYNSQVLLSYNAKT